MFVPENGQLWKLGCGKLGLYVSFNKIHVLYYEEVLCKTIK